MGGKQDGTRVLLLDVLAVAVSDDFKGRGVGTILLASLKRVARREMKVWECERALLLTQADNACISFWDKKCGFQRALDAQALCRSLRRENDFTIFEGATPMACALKPQAKKKVKRMGKASRRASFMGKTLSHNARLTANKAYSERRAPLGSVMLGPG